MHTASFTDLPFHFPDLQEHNKKVTQRAGSANPVPKADKLKKQDKNEIKSTLALIGLVVIVGGCESRAVRERRAVELSRLRGGQWPVASAGRTGSSVIHGG